MGMTAPLNLNSPVLNVKHSELKRFDSGGYKSKCPVCSNGILLIVRDKQTFKMIRQDRCVSCGQKVFYTDARIQGEELMTIN